MRWSTWNLWSIGPDLVDRTEAARSMLVEDPPDLCCLQEVRADDRLDVATVLAEASGLHLGRGPAVGADWWSGRVGAAIRVDNVLLSRWPIEEVTTVALPATPGSSEVRSLTHARIVTPGGPVRLASTQLSSSPTDSALRCRQVRALVEELDTARTADETVLLGGDLNAEDDSDEVRLLCGHKTAGPRPGFVLLDLWRFASPGEAAPTWDRANPHVAATREPTARIDYLLAGPTPSGVLPDAHVVRRFGAAPRAGTWASDHAGVMAELTL